MSEFGQSLPSLPQVFLDETSHIFSKSGFVSYLVRALETVGMVPVRGVWPYDPIATPENSGISEGDVHVFPFDYPDTSTFTVGGTLYRPCVAVAAWYGDLSSLTTNNEQNQCVVLTDAVRTDGVFDLANGFWIANRVRNPAHAYFGFNDDNTLITSHFPDSEGLYVLNHNWIPYTGAGTTDQEVLNVKYWFTYLGRAGLFVLIGTGSAEGQLSQHMACGFAFGGGRISGREISPDVNLNRANPVFPLALKNSNDSGDQYQPTANLWRTLILGMQYDAKSTLEPVRANLFNLENTELPFYPNYGPQTVPSPRVVTGGTGAHILGRVIVFPTETESDVGDWYSPIVSEIRSDGPQPEFGEVFTCPGLRFCDRTAPLGVREDPITLDDWYMIPVTNALMRMGLYFENGVTSSSLVSTSLTVTGTDSYTMAGPGGDGFTFPNLGGSLTAPTVAVTGDGVPAAVDWDDTQNTGQSPPDSNDQMVATILSGGGTNREAECTWTIVLSASDPVDTLYQVRFSALNRDDATTEDDNPLYFEAYQFGSWVRLLTLNSAGTNAAHASYNYQLFTYLVPLDSTAPSGTRRIQVRWIANKVGSLYGNTIKVKEVNVIRNRYL